LCAFSAPVESEKYQDRPIEPVEPFVGLNISKKGIFLNTTFLGQGDHLSLLTGNLRLKQKNFH